jgi:hypothetical protein
MRASAQSVTRETPSSGRLDVARGAIPARTRGGPTPTVGSATTKNAADSAHDLLRRSPRWLREWHVGSAGGPRDDSTCRDRMSPDAPSLVCSQALRVWGSSAPRDSYRATAPRVNDRSVVTGSSCARCELLFH